MFEKIDRIVIAVNDLEEAKSFFSDLLEMSWDNPGHVELALDALKRVLPEKAFEFFAPRTSSWEAPLDGSESSSQAPAPKETDFDLRTAKNQLPVGRSVHQVVAEADFWHREPDLPGPDVFEMPANNLSVVFRRS